MISQMMLEPLQSSYPNREECKMTLKTIRYNTAELAC